jgi:hypothetical protein
MNDTITTRRHTRASIRSASVYDGRRALGRVEIDDGGRHVAITTDGRRLGVFESLKKAVGAFETGEDRSS